MRIWPVTNSHDYSIHWALVFLLNEFILRIVKLLSVEMAIDPEVISPSNDRGSRAGRYVPKWAIYTSTGIGVLVLVGLIKTLLPLIGMACLLAFIWSQSTTNRRY